MGTAAAPHQPRLREGFDWVFEHTCEGLGGLVPSNSPCGSTVESLSESNTNMTGSVTATTPHPTTAANRSCYHNNQSCLLSRTAAGATVTTAGLRSVWEHRHSCFGVQARLLTRVGPHVARQVGLLGAGVVAVQTLERSNTCTKQAQCQRGPHLHTRGRCV